MQEVGEPLLDPEADCPGGHAVGEEHVADDVPPHEPLALLLAGEKGDDQDGHAVRPGEERVLRPPPGHDQRHVEAQHKGQGDRGQLVMAIGHHALEKFSRFLPLKSILRSYVLFNSEMDLLPCNGSPLSRTDCWE